MLSASQSDGLVFQCEYKAGNNEWTISWKCFTRSVDG